MPFVVIDVPVGGAKRTKGARRKHCGKKNTGSAGASLPSTPVCVEDDASEAAQLSSLQIADTFRQELRRFCHGILRRELSRFRELIKGDISRIVADAICDLPNTKCQLSATATDHHEMAAKSTTKEAEIKREQPCRNMTLMRRPRGARFKCLKRPAREGGVSDTAQFKLWRWGDVQRLTRCGADLSERPSHWPPEIKVYMPRWESWLPEDWTQGFKENGGVEERVFLSPQGVDFSEREKVEAAVGKELPSIVEDPPAWPEWLPKDWGLTHRKHGTSSKRAVYVCPMTADRFEDRASVERHLEKIFGPGHELIDKASVSDCDSVGKLSDNETVKAVAVDAEASAPVRLSDGDVDQLRRSEKEPQSSPTAAGPQHGNCWQSDDIGISCPSVGKEGSYDDEDDEGLGLQFKIWGWSEVWRASRCGSDVPEKPAHWPEEACVHVGRWASWLPEDWGHGVIQRDSGRTEVFIGPDGRAVSSRQDVEAIVGRQFDPNEKPPLWPFWLPKDGEWGISYKMQPSGKKVVYVSIATERYFWRRESLEKFIKDGYSDGKQRGGPVPGTLPLPLELKRTSAMWTRMQSDNCVEPSTAKRQRQEPVS
eukprot:TRINITY_DN1303_c0_g1_i1.p1 TRINITY_DN1303_c0_g1~~TRINITY_DN1303_c0_g1_i1.p1  ORF type:complete len:661 (-),score=92.00 TRINITY_DN1303_c0_g1_i1:249-2033(-)